MKSSVFITLSACSMMLTALGIDIMLPAFEQLRAHYGLRPESTDAAKIISFFFMGQIAQLLFGLLSDRFGRLRILRIGFPLYIIGGIAAAYAPDLSIMFAARFVAGMGASAIFVTTVAGVRDRFSGDQMARIMSLIFTIFLLIPIAAPFLGSAILSVASWRMVFLTPPLFGVIVFIWSFRLEESLPPERRTALQWPDIRNSVRRVVGNRIFLRYTAVTTILFIVFSAYISSSEHVIGVIYGKPHLFPWIFAAEGLVMACCTFMNARLSSRYGARKTIQWLVGVYATMAGLLLLLTLIAEGLPHMLFFCIAVGSLLGINLAVEPNSSALAMEPMEAQAGMASAIYGTSFFFVGAALGSFISHFMVSNTFPLVLSFFIIGLITVFLLAGDRRSIISHS